LYQGIGETGEAVVSKVHDPDLPAQHAAAVGDEVVKRRTALLAYTIPIATTLLACVV
jgi:hypothetical protein